MILIQVSWITNVCIKSPKIQFDGCDADDQDQASVSPGRSESLTGPGPVLVTTGHQCTQCVDQVHV